MPVEGITEGALNFAFPGRREPAKPIAEQCLRYDVHVVQIHDRGMGKAFAFPYRNLLGYPSNRGRDFGDNDFIEVCISGRTRKQQHRASTDRGGQIRPSNIVLFHRRVRVRRDLGRGSHISELT